MSAIEENLHNIPILIPTEEIGIILMMCIGVDHYKEQYDIIIMSWNTLAIHPIKLML